MTYMLSPNTGIPKRAAAEVGVNWKNGVYVGDKITDPKVLVKAKAKPNTSAYRAW